MFPFHLDRADVSNVAVAMMHHGHSFAGVVFLVRMACIRQPGFFFERKRIHISPEEHNMAGTVLQYTDSAMSADFGVDLEAKLLEMFGRNGCRSRFLFPGSGCWWGSTYTYS